MVKNPPANEGNMRREFSPWVEKILWRRAWQPTPQLFFGEPHGQRSLAGYHPEGHKETQLKRISLHACTNPHPVIQTINLSHLLFLFSSSNSSVCPFDSISILCEKIFSSFCLHYILLILYQLSSFLSGL